MNRQEKFEDRFFKTFDLKENNELLKMSKIDFELIKEAPNELTEIYSTNRILDKVYETKDGGYVIFEYLSNGRQEKTIRRSAVYAALLFEKTGKDVDTVIIFTKNVENRNSKIQYGRNLFNPYFIVLNDRNAEEELEKIQNKINKNKKLNKRDLLILTSLPLMNIEKDEIKLIKNTLHTINTINNLKIEEYERLITRHEYLIKKFVKNDKNQEVEINKEIKKMQESIIKKYGDRKQKYGISIGENKNRINIAKEMLKENYPIKEISKLTKLTEKEIMKIK